MTGDNEQPRPPKVTISIQATKAKGSEKISETMINKNKDQRDMQLKYQQNQQLEQVKNEIEEYRNMLLKDKWQQESQQLKNKIDEQKKILQLLDM